MTSVEYDENLLSRLKDKVVIVTGGFAFKGVNAGGARGIGMATVEFFHEHGAILEFADVNDQNGKALESQLKE